MGLEDFFVHKKRSLKNLIIAGALASSMIFASCAPGGEDEEPSGGGNSGGGNGGGSGQTTQTHVLSESELNDLSYVSSEGLIFSNPVDFSSGDIIVAGISDMTPNGFLRKVDYLSNDRTLVYTDPATLEEVVEDASFEMTHSLKPENADFNSPLRGISSNSSSLQTQNGYDFGINFDGTSLFEGSFGKVTANGNLYFNSDLVFGFDISDYRLNNLVFKKIIEEESNLEIVSDISLPDINEIMEIGSYNFHPFIAGVIPGTAIPIIVHPSLEVILGIEGNASGIGISMHHDSDITAGLSYNSGVWDIISDFSNDANLIITNENRSSDFDAYVGPRLNFKVYESAGPYGEIRGSMNLNSSQDWWGIYGRLELRAGVSMSIFGRNIADYSTSLIGWEELLGLKSRDGSGDGSGDGLEGKILFHSINEDSTESHIYSINPDGSNRTNLSSVSKPVYAWDVDPAWHPQGEKIIFSSDGDIQTMDLDGSNLKDILLSDDSFRYYNPVYSPDGQKIAFVANPSGLIYDKIWVMDSDGKNITRPISNSDYRYNNPAWSPNGERLAYSSDEDGDFEIYVKNLVTGDKEQLTYNSSYDTNPAWTPSGDKLAFNSYRDGILQIYIMDSDGSNQDNISNTDTYDKEPSWSPSGDKIVYISGYDVWIMNSDGSSKNKLIDDGGAYHPSWSPSP